MSLLKFSGSRRVASQVLEPPPKFPLYSLSPKSLFHRNFDRVVRAMQQLREELVECLCPSAASITACFTAEDHRPKVPARRRRLLLLLLLLLLTTTTTTTTSVPPKTTTTTIATTQLLLITPAVLLAAYFIPLLSSRLMTQMIVIRLCSSWCPAWSWESRPQLRAFDFSKLVFGGN